ncbi:MAG: YggT family protein [Coriobacteriales bacterium]|jgi:YggT family protein|nr:YggT family protein [Coriobacteriales bacterium]
MTGVGMAAAGMASASMAASLIPYPLGTVVTGLVQFYVLLIVAWAVLSWFEQGKGGFISEVYGILDRIVSPYIDLFRRFIPSAGGIDFSPLIAIIVLQVLLRILV